MHLLDARHCLCRPAADYELMPRDLSFRVTLMRDDL